MISDVIHVSNNGVGIDEALEQAEKSAVFRGLDHRQTLHVRLFAEEMLGMMRSLTGEREGDFCVESSGNKFQLHLKVITMMNAEKRRRLLEASSSGKNAAAKGVMGKIKDLFEQTFENPAGAFVNEPFVGATHYSAETMMSVWTLTEYKHALEEDRARREAWDELERSVISKLADEVRVAISNGTVEMTVEKTF